MLHTANHPSTHMTIFLVIWYILYVLLVYTNERHYSHLMRFVLEVTKTMKKTSTGFKEKIFILQPLSKSNLEIKSKQIKTENVSFYEVSIYYKSSIL